MLAAFRRLTSPRLDLRTFCSIITLSHSAEFSAESISATKASMSDKTCLCSFPHSSAICMDVIRRLDSEGMGLKNILDIPDNKKPRSTTTYHGAFAIENLNVLSSKDMWYVKPRTTPRVCQVTQRDTLNTYLGIPSLTTLRDASIANASLKEGACAARV